MYKRLLLVGGGHAHMMTLAALHTFVEKRFEPVVIAPSPYHYYSGMGPGMLGNTYRSEEIRFATRSVVEQQGGQFILGRAVSIDPEEKTVFLESGRKVHYDVVSFNVGSYVPEMDGNGETVPAYPVKPIEKLNDARTSIQTLLSEKSARFGVIGGGASAAEISGSLWKLAADHGNTAARIGIYAGGAFMERFPRNVREKVSASLTVRGVQILEKVRVKKILPGGVLLENGTVHDLDLVFLATGVRPSPIFRVSGLPTGPDGGLAVNRYLQSTAYPDIFGGGDCIWFNDQPLDKVGVYAVRENPVLRHNLMARLSGNPLMPFRPGGDYLLIFNMGDGTGVLHKWGMTWHGRLAFRFKDYLDRKFMRRFKYPEN